MGGQGSLLLFIGILSMSLLKITELLNDVERLKQALNGLSQLTHNIPAKKQNPQTEVLQNQVETLQQQLAVSRDLGHEDPLQHVRSARLGYGGKIISLGGISRGVRSISPLCDISLLLNKSEANTFDRFL